VTFDLTPRQGQILNFIKLYQAAHGCSPKFEEIALAMGTVSRGNISRYLTELVAKGYLERARGRRRAMVVVDRTDWKAIAGALQDENDALKAKLDGNLSTG
jgi:SOS-response transcriptional repressor LexA